MRDEVEAGLAVLGARIFSSDAPRLPGTTFFAFEAIDGETLVGKLDRAGFACASGSACSSADPEPSKTLIAMGVAPEMARGAIRVSVGRGTSAEDVHRFVEVLRVEVRKLREMTAMAG